MLAYFILFISKLMVYFFMYQAAEFIFSFIGVALLYIRFIIQLFFSRKENIRSKGAIDNCDLIFLAALRDNS